MPALGLEPGTPAPAFELESIDGGHVSLDNLREPGNPVLLLFTSPTCGPCSVLMPTVAEWQREHYGELTIALLSDGEVDAIRAEAEEHGLVNVLVDDGLATYEAYEANGTPSAVLIGDDGTVATWLAAGSDWIESVVQQALAGLGRTPGLPVGTELPDLGSPGSTRARSTSATSIERESVLALLEPRLRVLPLTPRGHPGLGGRRRRTAHRRSSSSPPATPSASRPRASRARCCSTPSGRCRAHSARTERRWPSSSRPTAALPRPVVAAGPAVLELLGAGELVTAS